MQQNGFDLPGRKACQKAQRHQDHRPYIADDNRDFGEAGLEQRDRPREPDARGKPGEPPLPGIGRATHAPPAQTLRGNPACQSTQLEHQDSRDPERRQPGRKIRDAALRRAFRYEPINRTVGDSAGFHRRAARRIRRRGNQASVGHAEGRQHAEHRQARRGVPGARRTDGTERGRQTERDRRAFPHEVNERPAERPGGRRLHPGIERSHRVSFWYSSSSLRSSASSSFEALRAESAPSIRLLADPLNARWSRSPASCRCVHSRGRAAS